MEVDKQVIQGSVALLILSAINGALTLWGLGLDAIKEANPVMQIIITKSPGAFMTVKLLLLVILGFIFWRIRNRSRRFVAYALGFALSVYVVVMEIHVYWIHDQAGVA